VLVSIPTHLSTLTFGTRPSALARWQTQWVVDRLRAAWPGLDCRIAEFVTSGDRDPHTPLPEIGGKGLFTEELESALRSGEIDIAVHSLKDLPVEDAPGLALGAIGERADARDVWVSRDGWTLATLPRGARVGTCSPRRTAQILAARPDLTILPLRGNVDLRIQKAMRGDYAAIVLAAAGVLRLGMSECISDYLPLEIMLPAPGQGALAVQCRAGDRATRDLLAAIDDAATRAAVTAERVFLLALGGGCSAPIAAYAEWRMQNAECRMIGLVASLDGRRLIRVRGAGTDPESLGRDLAHQALAQGAGELLT